jgi:protein SCO1
MGISNYTIRCTKQSDLEPYSRQRQLTKYALLAAVLLVIPLSGLILFGVMGTHHFNTLPYYGPAGQLSALEDGSAPSDAQRLPDFTLTNHLDEPFGLRELKDRVWLAAFFNTGDDHAAQSTQQLLWPNFRYRGEADIGIVCFTTDASHDTPKTLESYVQRNTRYNDFEGKWQFLTGDQAAIDDLIFEGFMIERDSADWNNIATLWLVDGSGYLRGWYHGMSEDAVKEMVEDIALLKKERSEADYAAEHVQAIDAYDALPILGPEGHTVPPFAFTGLDSVEVSHYNTEGKVRVVDYFFSHCPTICPVMSSQLARLQGEAVRRGLGADDLLILSHTVDPERDTPERLEEYAMQLGADTSWWKFVTGEQDDLYDMARHGYYLTALESDTAEGGFFHSDTFVLVDRLDRIRGYYDGTSTKEVDKLLNDLEQLVRDPLGHNN